MKLYLIRHGESSSDIENRYGGDYDDHLTNKGIFQAEEMAYNLSETRIGRIFSSPKHRARETAEVLSKTLGCEMEIMEGLKESNRYGILTGMNKEEAKQKFPDQVAIATDFYATIIGGEAYQDFRDRVLAAFQEATLKSSTLQAAAIVSHGGPMRVIVREVLRLGELIEIGDCAVIILEEVGGKFSLAGMENSTLQRDSSILKLGNLE